MAKTVQIKLRELSKHDIPELNRWRNDPAVTEQLGANFHYIDQSIDENWFADYQKSRHQHVRLSIINAETDEYIGNVNLTNIHPINRCAEFSIVIGNPNYWGKGIGTQAGIKMLEHAFQNLNLHRVYLYVLTENQRAIRLYERMGLKSEGISRQAVFKNGRYLDLAVMAILAHEFRDSNMRENQALSLRTKSSV